MKRDEARKLLGLERTAAALTADIVVEAWRNKVKLAHPDTAVSAGESKEPSSSVQLLTMARKTLLESLDGTDLCCRLCAGRGMVKSGLGWRTCVSCKGTGERK